LKEFQRVLFRLFSADFEMIVDVVDDFRDTFFAVDYAPDFRGDFIEMDDFSGIDFDKYGLTLDYPPWDFGVF